MALNSAGAASATSRLAHDDGNAAWAVTGRLVAGPALYGGLGGLLDRWVGTAPAFLCVGVILGFVAAIYLVIKRLEASTVSDVAVPSTSSVRRAATGSAGGATRGR